MKNNFLALCIISIFFIIQFYLQKYEYINNIIFNNPRIIDYIICFFKIFINYTSFLLFTYIICLIYQSRFKIFSYPFIFLQSSIFIGIITSRSIYNSALNYTILENILNTNTAEILSISKIIFPFFIIFFAIFYLLLQTIKNIRPNYYIILSLIGLLLTNLTLNYFYFNSTNKVKYKSDGFEFHFIMLNESDPLFITNQLFNLYNYNNALSAISNNTPLKLNINKAEYNNIVLILGESSSRNNMSLYGYQHPTTPMQDNEKKHMLIYKNAYSPAAYTINALKHILTIAGQKYEHTKIEDYSNNIIRIANQIGYETTWISMQEKNGLYNNFTSIIASNSSNQFWLKGYDEEVINPFNKIINSNKKNKLIIIHLNGSHTSAKDRYPEKFNKFKSDKDGINEYNNSIYYTDYVIGKIIELLKPHDKSVLIYTSDHGQEYNKTLNSFTHSQNINGFKVPLWIWDKNQNSMTKNNFIQNTEVYNLINKFLGIDHQLGKKKKYKFCVGQSNNYINFDEISK